MSSGTIPPPIQGGVPVPPPPPAARKAGPKLAVFIDQRLEQTRRHVRWVDVTAAAMTLTAAGLVYLFLLALADHWLFSGGLGFRGRLLGWGLLIAAGGYYFARYVLPPLLHRVNPLFAAQTIENARPSIKNSLINWLLLRREPNGVAPAIYQAVEQRAASEVSHTSVDSAVDRAQLIRLGCVLVAVVLAVGCYLIFSPKNPLPSFGRIIWPWAEIAAPTRVVFSDVRPGNAVAVQGDFLAVMADVTGLRHDETVLLYYTTADGQSVDEAVPMSAPPGEHRFQGVLPPGSNGLQQNLQYYLAAGDARTRTYPVEVQINPVMTVERVEYRYPKYTGIPDRVVEHEGDLRAAEGTQVTLHAQANQPIQRAFVDLGCDGRSQLRMTVSGSQATARFTLRPSRQDPSRPEYEVYQLRFTDSQGRANRHLIRHRIDMIRDLPPVVEFLEPKAAEIQVPENGRFDMKLRAIDPDYALRRVVLQMERKHQNLLLPPLLDRQPPAEAFKGEFSALYQFQPARLGLKAGDQVVYWAEADDNKAYDDQQVPANHSETSKRFITIVGAGSPTAEKQQPTPAGGQQSPEKKSQQGDSTTQKGDSSTQKGDSGQDKPFSPDRQSGDQQHPPASGDQKKSDPGQSSQNNQGQGNQGQGNQGQSSSGQGNQKGDQGQSSQGNQGQGNQQQGQGNQGQGNQGQSSSGQGNQKGDQGQSSQGNQGQGNQGQGNQKGDQGNPGQPQGGQDQNNSGGKGNASAVKSDQPSGEPQSGGQPGQKQSGGIAGQPQAGKSSGNQQGDSKSGGSGGEGSQRIDGQTNPGDAFEKILQYAKEKQPAAGGQQQPGDKQPAGTADQQSAENGGQQGANGQGKSSGTAGQSGKAPSPSGQQAGEKKSPSSGDQQSAANGGQKSGENPSPSGQQAGDKKSPSSGDQQSAANGGQKSGENPSPSGQQAGDKKSPSAGDQQSAANGGQKSGEKPSPSGQQAGDKKSPSSGDQQSAANGGQKSGENPSPSGQQAGDKKSPSSGDQQSAANGGEKSGENPSPSGQQAGDKKSPSSGDQQSAANGGQKSGENGSEKSADKTAQGGEPKPSADALAQNSGKNPPGNSGTSEGAKQGQSQASEKNANPGGDSSSKSEAGQGAQAPPMAGKSPEQQANGQTQPKPDAKGGDPEGSAGKAGAGKPSADKAGSPSPQEGNQAHNQQTAHPQGDPGKNDQGKSNEAGQSPSTSPKDSNSQGETAGDRSGGGEKGGGQRSNQSGTGSAGTHTAADEGGSQSDQKGNGDPGHKAGDQAKSDHPTGLTSKAEDGNGSHAGEQGKQEPGAGKSSGEKQQAAAGTPKPADQAGSQKGAGQDKPSGPAGQSGDKSPSASNQQAGSQEGASTGIPRGGNAPGSTSAQASSPPPVAAAPGDDPNLEYANKQTDLALTRLRDELKKDKPDPELLKRLGWTRDDMERFYRQWLEMKRSAQVASPQAPTAQKDLHDALRSLGLTPRGTSLRTTATGSDSTRQGEALRVGAPAEWEEFLRAYTRGVAGEK
jgi:hypothetical protein